MLDRWLVRLSSQAALFVVVAGLVAGIVMWVSGDPAGPSVLRFTGIAVATVSLALAVRLAVAGRQRGTLPDLLAAEPLPFFDEELAAGALQRLSRPTGLRAGVLACVALAGLGIVGLLAGRAPLVRGVIDVGQTSAVEAWQPSDGQLTPRTLPDAIRLDTVTSGTSPVATFSVAPLATRDESLVSVGPLGVFRSGDLVLRWQSVTAGDEAGGARLTVTDRASGASDTVTVPLGSSVSVPALEGVSVGVTDAVVNRLGGLGPAVQVTLRCDDETEDFWLHSAAPDFQAERGEGCAAVELDAIEPVLTARIGVVDGPAGAVLPAAAGLFGLLVVALGFGLFRPVFVRGRPGDYEIVAIRLLIGSAERRLSTAAEQLMDSARLAEWRKLRRDLVGRPRSSA